MDLVLGTTNEGKIKEIKTLLRNLKINFLSLAEIGFTKEIEEDGNSYRRNAVKKALEICRYCHLPVLAEDSGLEVEYLKGAPGIYSARLAPTDEERNKKILSLLKGVPANKRTAYFISVVALALPDQRVITKKGTCRGIIAFEPRGSGGFGFDPIFIIPAYRKTLGELGEEIKNKISHRARALEKMKLALERLIKKDGA
jgi:XTP/dITP diphosphohydrolase